MNEQNIALRVIGRLNDPRATDDKWPVTLPEPTTAQLIDWIEYREPAYCLAVYERHGPDYFSGCQNEAQADAYRAMLSFVQHGYEAGDIDAETRARLTTTRQISTDRRRELRTRLMTWKPFYVYHNRNEQHDIVKIYEMTGSDGQRYELSYEYGVWYRHKGKAYPKS